MSLMYFEKSCILLKKTMRMFGGQKKYYWILSEGIRRNFARIRIVFLEIRNVHQAQSVYKKTKKLPSPTEKVRGRQ